MQAEYDGSVPCPASGGARKTQLNLVVGINGTGKTTWIRNNVVEKDRRKVLVVTPDTAEWRQLPTVRSGAEIRSMQGAARIIYQGPETLEAIKNNFFGGALVLDDAMAYLTEQTPATMQYIYIRRRQFGIDVYIVAHGLRQLPPKCFTFGSFLVLFFTTENFARRKNELQEDIFNSIMAAQRDLADRVRQGDNYGCKILRLDLTIR